MPIKELHTDDVKIDQKPPMSDDPSLRDSDIVIATDVLKKEYADALAFMEDPVRIRIEPSNEKYAAGAFPVWCNGKGGEVFQNGRWFEITWLPVGIELVTKRKYLEVMLRAKIDAVSTEIVGENTDRPDNQVTRFTRPVHSISILEDPSPGGPAWMREIRRRNY